LVAVERRIASRGGDPLLNLGVLRVPSSRGEPPIRGGFSAYLRKTDADHAGFPLKCGDFLIEDS